MRDCDLITVVGIVESIARQIKGCTYLPYLIHTLLLKPEAEECFARLMMLVQVQGWLES